MENSKKEKPADIYVERDVLGLEKQKINTAAPKAVPNKFLIGLGLVIIMLILFLLFG